MTAPNTPTETEIRDAADGFRWEYDQDTIDVTEMGDPPNSRPPLVVVRRRIVGRWETYPS